MSSEKRILIYGYGNPGRQDDGLGAAMISMVDNWLEQNKLSGVETDTNYQLNIEDAASVAAYDKIIFVDASVEDIEAFSFTEVKPSDARVEFSMHAVSPAFVMDLCQKLYAHCPEAHLLHIRGEEWEFREELSAAARQNLQLAFRFLTQYLTAGV